jgi:cytidylate kinase
MGAQIVTIAMTTGAAAETIGRLVADRLGFLHVSDEIIDGAAAKAGVSRETVAEVERSPSLMSRIMMALASTAVAEAPGPVTMEHVDTSPSYQRLIQDVIRQTAAKGNVVIVAHGASILLAGTPELLRVLVTGSPAIRARRLAAEARRDAAWAAREIERTDGERRSFFRRLHGLDAELPTHYDLVVNTDVLSVEEAARIITAAARKT